MLDWELNVESFFLSTNGDYSRIIFRKETLKIQQIEKRILPEIPRIQHGQLLSLLPEVLAISDSPSENQMNFFFNFWRMLLLKWISCHFRVKIKERKFLGCLNPELRFFIFHKITLHLHFGSRSFNHSETWKK